MSSVVLEKWTGLTLILLIEFNAMWYYNTGWGRA